MNLKYILLVLLLFLVACGGNDKVDDPCLDIICENGDCVDGVCDCDSGWAGENCEVIQFPTSIVFSDLVINMPTPPGKDTWDEAGPEEGADIIIAFYAEGDFVLDELTLSDADHTESLVTDFTGPIYTDLEFSVEVSGASFYSIGLYDDDGNQMTEFMEASYLYFDFKEDEEEPFPSDAVAFGTFNGGSVSFLDVSYRF